MIASGGAGAVEHFAPAVDAGADAVLAATVFHFGTLRIPRGQGRPARRRSPGPLTQTAITHRCNVGKCGFTGDQETSGSGTQQ